MEYLKDSVRLRAYGQRDPLVEYKTEGHRMFKKLLSQIESAIANTLMSIKVAPTQAPTPQPIQAAGARRIGRNDPCPCGKKDSTGKPLKYKKCCWPKYG